MPSTRLITTLLFIGLPVVAFAQTPYYDVSQTALPLEATQLRSMDVEMGDADGDGDLDIFVAMEFSKNLLLTNKGDGTFEDGSDRFPDPVHDSEDIALGDFDADGDLDAVFVAEDDRVDLYNRNDGTGHFEIAPLPVAEISNGVAHGDVDGDGDEDLVIANAGANALWRNDGGTFSLEANAIPTKKLVSQDVQLGDVDGDGDLDLVEANEGANRLLLNDGTGTFTVFAGAFGDILARESRQADLGDVDADGDLDIVFGNVSLGYARRQAEAGNQIGYANRLFINNGDGSFTQSDRFPDEELQSLIVDFIDLDADGDLDLLVGHVKDFRNPSDGRVRAYLNDGSGKLSDGTETIFPKSFTGNAWDTAVGDVNGDGIADIYLANRHGEDRLILGQ